MENWTSPWFKTAYILEGLIVHVANLHSRTDYGVADSSVERRFCRFRRGKSRAILNVGRWMAFDLHWEPRLNNIFSGVAGWLNAVLREGLATHAREAGHRDL